VTYSPNSELAFSQVREDPRVEWQVIQRLAHRQDLRVLLVASGGCTALSLLALPSVASIAAVDLNPAQLHLVELRRQALQHLSQVEQLQLIGDKAGESSKVKFYESLRQHLPDATRNHWDERLDQIAYGVNQIGKFESLFRELAQQFTHAGLNPLHDPVAALNHPQWREVFETVFNRDKLIHTFGAAAVNYSMDRSFGTHFAAVFAEALQRFVPTQNYFLTQVWRDRYAEGLEGLPLYLQAPFQAKIHQYGSDRLQLHQGHFAEVMVQLAQVEKFDLIQFSNISDWMPLPDLHQMLAQAVESLKPGGALIGRRLNGDHRLASVMAEHLAIERSLSAQLLASDRSFFYQEVVVGVHRL